MKLPSDRAEALVDELKARILPECTDGEIIVTSQINRIFMGEMDGDETFAVQFQYISESVFKNKKIETMQQFLGMVDEQFKGQYVYFATMMELLHHQK